MQKISARCGRRTLVSSWVLAGVLAAILAAFLLASPAHADDYAQANRMFADGQHEDSRRILEALGKDRSPEANYLLGLEYIQGLGGRKKVSDGITAIKAAAEGGLPIAQFYLAEAFFSQDRRYVDEADALRYLQAAAESGNSDARALWALRKPTSPTVDVEPAPQVPEPATDTPDVDADNALVECMGTGNCGPQGAQSVGEQAAPDETKLGEDLPVAPAAGPNDLQTMLVLGGIAVAAFLLWLFFGGTRCPRCGKIRSSDVMGHEQTGQFITTKMQTVRETTTHRDSHYGRTGTSEHERKVPVTITMREIDEHRHCRACGHDFIKEIQREAR